MKSWLKDNNIEMYSVHNDEKYVFAERCIRKLKNKIYKYKTSMSKNVYIDRLDKILRTSKYKYIFEKGYVPSWSEQVFMIKKVKNTIPWTYVISDVKGKEIIVRFYKN